MLPNHVEFCLDAGFHPPSLGIHSPSLATEAARR